MTNNKISYQSIRLAIVIVTTLISLNINNIAVAKTTTYKCRESQYLNERIKPSKRNKEFHVLITERSRLTSKAKAYIKDLKKKYPKGYFEPKLVKIPSGSIMLKRRRGPLQYNLLAFYLGKYEVTFEEFDLCFASGGCDYFPDDCGWGRGLRPVIMISWNDIYQYITWLRKATKKKYRIPSPQEWLYAAGFGETYSVNETKEANCGGCNSEWSNIKTATVGSFKPNKFGLYDMFGNVYEWVLPIGPFLEHSQVKLIYPYDCFDGPRAETTSFPCSSSWKKYGGSWFQDDNDIFNIDHGAITYNSRALNHGFRLALMK